MNEQKTCFWCHKHRKNEIVPIKKHEVELGVIDEDYGQYVHITLIHYCPFCGRYLDDTIPTAHWIRDESTGEVRCSRCNDLVGVTSKRTYNELVSELHYCSNCGAKMDGERKTDANAERA